jgi:hypothetical protein
MSIREGWSPVMDKVRWPFDPPIAGGIRKGTGEASRPDGPYVQPQIMPFDEGDYEAHVDVDHETPE